MITYGNGSDDKTHLRTNPYEIKEYKITKYKGMAVTAPHLREWFPPSDCENTEE